MAPDLSHRPGRQDAFVALLYGSPAAVKSAVDASPWAEGSPADPQPLRPTIPGRLLQAWAARLFDTVQAEATLDEIAPALPGQPGPLRAMAALIRAEGERLRGRPEMALASAEAAMCDLQPAPCSGIETELRDFGRVLLLQALGDLGRPDEQRAMLAEAPTTVADWRRAHQAGATGQLFFVAATHFRALSGGPSAAGDEPAEFRALLEDAACPALVRAWGHEAMASVDFRCGRYGEALQHYQAAFQFAQAAGSVRQMFVAALNIATCHGNGQAPQRALVWARRALEVLPAGQWPVAEGLAALRLSTALRVAGQPALALTHAERACRVLEASGPSRNRRVAWLTLGEALLAVGWPGEALERFDAVCQEAEPGAEHDLRVEALRGGALALARTGRGLQALPRLADALALAGTMASRPREAECLLAQLEVWVGLGPEGRAATGCNDAFLALAFEQTAEALRSSSLSARQVECTALRAQWATQCGADAEAAASWRSVAVAWQEQNRADLAEQLEGLEELGRLRLAEQALTHARERETLLAMRLTLLERQRGMLEMLEAFSRHVHAGLAPEDVFQSLQHQVARMLDGRRLQLWVLESDGRWTRWFGEADPVDMAAPRGAVRVRAPLRDAGRLIGRLSAELPVPAGDGRTAGERRRIFGLIAEHAALVLRSWLQERRLRTATEAARDEASRERGGRERAERLISDKRRFLAQAGHELRTPLNAIVGFAQLLVASPDLADGPARAHARTIAQAGRQLNCLVDDLLELSLLDAGGVSLEPQPLELATEVAAALRMLEPRARQAAIALMGTGGDGLLARADRVRLQQLLANLVSNAIKYGRPGGRVEVSCCREADAVRIDVDDDGLGVPEDARAGLFEPFNRLGRQHSGIEGTGLGLSIVRRLAEAMGGRVAYAARDRGSRFSLWLPAA